MLFLVCDVNQTVLAGFISYNLTQSRVFKLFRFRRRSYHFLTETLAVISPVID